MSNAFRHHEQRHTAPRRYSYLEEPRRAVHGDEVFFLRRRGIRTFKTNGRNRYENKRTLCRRSKVTPPASSPIGTPNLHSRGMQNFARKLERPRLPGGNLHLYRRRRKCQTGKETILKSPPRLNDPRQKRLKTAACFIQLSSSDARQTALWR